MQNLFAKMNKHGIHCIKSYREFLHHMPKNAFIPWHQPLQTMNLFTYNYGETYVLSNKDEITDSADYVTVNDLLNT